MLLNDIGNAPDATFRKINQHLETNYGFKIAEDVSDKDLVSIMEQIEEEVTDLKLKGDDAKSSSEISKRLLVLEGLQALKEYSMMTFQSPKLGPVISDLVDYVVKSFERSGVSQANFDRAMENAMDAYRSSEFRFPDEMISQKVRSEALARISRDQSGGDSAGIVEDSIEDIENEAAGDAQMSGVEVDEDTYGHVGKRHDFLDQLPQSMQAKRAMSALDNPRLSIGGAAGGEKYDTGNSQVPMIRDRHGRMVAAPNQSSTDPHNKMGANFMKPSPRRVREGNEMKEHKNLVKNLRRLLETEVSQAEVMMAAKGFAQELQEMIEKIGRLQNEDLPPVTDQMRETYGMESASAFQTQIYGALQSVMDALYTAKGQVDDAVSSMAATGQFDAPTDMDKDIGMDDGMGAEDPTAMDAGSELDLDNIEDDLGADPEMDDEFGGAETEEPLGRSMKAEAVRLQQKVLEMHRLVAKARKLREARG
jgi:hypothetical protein